MGRLVIITASNDDASKVYVKKKIEKGIELGHTVEHNHISSDSNHTLTYHPDGGIGDVEYLGHITHGFDMLEELHDVIRKCNKRRNVDGILLQLPLDESISHMENELIDMIDPSKDVDCLTTYNQGKIMLGDNSYLPCTTQAVLDMIKNNCDGDLKRETVHVVGRSKLVTKPLIMALINEGASVRNWNSNFTKYEIQSSVIDDQLLPYSGVGTYEQDVHMVSGIGVAEYFDFSREQMYNHYSGPTDSIEYEETGLYLYDIGMNRDSEGKLCGDFKRDLGFKFQSIIPGTKEEKSIGNYTVENVYKNLDKLIRRKNNVSN